jgi:hypothetical protein
MASGREDLATREIDTGDLDTRYLTDMMRRNHPVNMPSLCLSRVLTEGD